GQRMSAVDGQNSIDLPAAQDIRRGAVLKVMLALAERHLIDVALGESVSAIEIQASPVAASVDVEIEARVLGLHPHGLTESVRRGHREAVGEALVELGLQTVVHGAVTDVTVLHARLLAISRK